MCGLGEGCFAPGLGGVGGDLAALFLQVVGSLREKCSLLLLG